MQKVLGKNQFIEYINQIEFVEQKQPRSRFALPEPVKEEEFTGLVVDDLAIDGQLQMAEKQQPTTCNVVESEIPF